MNAAQEAYTKIDYQLAQLIAQVDSCYHILPDPLRKAYDQLGSSIRWGCHVDLDPGQQPDECVISSDKHSQCVYARKGMRPEQCEYWKPITPGY